MVATCFHNKYIRDEKGNIQPLQAYGARIQERDIYLVWLESIRSLLSAFYCILAITLSSSPRPLPTSS